MCHEFVPARRKACPSCGATASDGWSSGAASDGLDLPDDSFNYDEFVEREFGTPKPRFRRDRRTLWTVTAIILLLALTAGYWLF